MLASNNTDQDDFFFKFKEEIPYGNTYDLTPF